jgi:predicted DNA-binding protein YlxM (UPF0122 family)
MNYPQHIIDRFWSKVKFPEDIDDCWIWISSFKTNSKESYGQFGLLGKLQLSHRFAYEYYNGLIPNGLLVLHDCDNPSCVNPNHLYTSDQLQNMKDRNNKERQAKGSNNGKSILTEEKCWEILNLIYTGELKTPYEIMDKYNMSRQAIYDFLNGKNWSHITKLFPIDLKTLKNKIIR